MNHVLAGLTVIMLVPVHLVHGEQVAFEFTGTVTQAATAFGESLVLDSPVTGRFTYDLDSVDSGNPGGCGPDCLAYRQDIWEGFSITIDGLTLTADEYLVIVGNDNMGFQDIFAVTWNSMITPALRPLEATIDGQSQQATQGLFSVNLFAFSPFVFPDSSLPGDLVLGDFGLQFNALSDEPTGLPVQFNIDSLVPIDSIVKVPEPASAFLLLSGGLILACRGWSRYRRRNV